MKYQPVAALLAAAALVSPTAFAQPDEEAVDAPETAQDPEPLAEEAPAEEPPAAVEPEATPVASATLSTEVGAGGAAVAGDAGKKASSREEEVVAPTNIPLRVPRYGNPDEWSVDLYGYGRFDAMHDTTQSFVDGYSPRLIQRAGTYAGDHGRNNFTARDSRIGLYVGAPDFEGMHSYLQLEFDFFGLVPTEATERDSIQFGPVRMRHAFYKLETPIIDVLAGQYFELFGWGGQGFYPGTIAFLGVPGQLFVRNPQLRFSKRLDFGTIAIEPAVAAVRPAQRDSDLPDFEGGIRLDVPGWNAAMMQGFGRPLKIPARLGISGVYRDYRVPVFNVQPGSASASTNAYGAAVNAMIPVIPVETIEDRSNALTVTGEFSIGTGIADLYTGMDGGARFPVLPDPGNSAAILPVYQQNIDNGLVAFDRNYDLKTINWLGFVVGLQYYLPIDNGRAWVTGIYSHVESDNIKDLTPLGNWGGIFTGMDYIDANLVVAITPAILAAFSFETIQQTFGDETPPTPVYDTAPVTGVDVGTSNPTVAGTGGDAITARNNRFHIATMFFF